MANDLVINERPDFLPAPTGKSSAMSEFMGGLGGSGGLDMPVLSVRGKVFRLRRDGQEVSLKTSLLDVILVGARNNTSRRFYDSNYQSGEIKAPTCASADGMVPDDNVQEKQADACATCPRNVWEKTARGMRKACDDYKRVLVFLPEKGIYSPVILDVAATSLRKKKGETGPELQMREYIQQLARNEFEPHQVVTTLGFTDDEYPRLQFSFRRVVNREEYESVMACRESDDFAAALSHREEEGEIKEVPVEAPKPTYKQQKAKVEEPEPQVEEAAEVAPEPEPVVEAAPEPQPEPEDSGDDDSLDDILAMLK